MKQNSHPPLSQQQNRINYLQNKFTPYFLILLFTAAITALRIYMIPEWTLSFQLLAFCNQTLFMIGIWHLIKWLSKILDRKLPFEAGPLKRMFVQILLSLLILAPLVGAGLYFALPYLPSFVNKQFLTIIVVLFAIMIMLFNFSFYAAHFFKNWQSSVEEKAQLEIQAAALEREKFNLQYHQLRNQVNPHYLFNTLSSLDGLIVTNPELASEFVRHMSKVYRYVLQHKENEVVNLEEELEFIGHYIELLHIRYGQGLNIHYKISEEAKEKGIVMVTLQMLIDNAVKHNSIQIEQPLKVVIWDEGEYLVVYNNKQLRTQVETSNQQGLGQLKQLYGYHSEKKVLIEDNHEYYTIKIPLL